MLCVPVLLLQYADTNYAYLDQLGSMTLNDPQMSFDLIFVGDACVPLSFLPKGHENPSKYAGTVSNFATINIF